MATDKCKKMDVEEFYARRAEVQNLVIQGIITQDIMDGAMENIARENDLLGVVDIPLNQYQHMDSSARTITILPANPKMKLPNLLAFSAPTPKLAPVPASKDINVLASSEQPMLEYISLTELVRSYHMDNPSYAIQSWLRSERTLAFLDLWEREHNPAYDARAYATLLEKKKSTSFTVTAKQWIDQTKAIGITSKQGRQGGTFSHPMIACQFATWLSPKYMMSLIKMSRFGKDFFKVDL